MQTNVQKMQISGSKQEAHNLINQANNVINQAGLRDKFAINIINTAGSIEGITFAINEQKNTIAGISAKTGDHDLGYDDNKNFKHAMKELLNALSNEIKNSLPKN